MASRRASVEERLHSVAEIGKRAPASLANELRPFLRDKAGIVAGAAAKIAATHGLRELEDDLKDAFARFVSDPIRTDPGCRGKLGAAEALRMLDVRATDVFLRGVSLRQLERSWGPPIDAAAPLRVCCAAGLLEAGHPLALLEVAPLLADPEANARAGVASVLGGVGGEACEALLRLKVRAGDPDPGVIGACLQALLRASFDRALPFVRATMEHADEEVVRHALLAIGETRDEGGFAVLREYADRGEATDDGERTAASAPRVLTAEVRKTALLAMALSRLPAANAYLIDLVERGPERDALEALDALAGQSFDPAQVERLRAVAISRGLRSGPAPRTPGGGASSRSRRA